MAKKIREGMWISIAPNIDAIIEDGVAKAYDRDDNGRELNLNNIDDKITIYERQVQKWFLDIAQDLKRNDNAGFAILMIATSYVESIQQTYEGQPSTHASKACFLRGFRRIFDPNSHDNDIRSFYDQVRNGLFHDGMTKDKVIINSEYEDAIDFSDSDIIKINPHLVLDQICSDFQSYLSKLKNPNESELRTNFDNSFKF
ncbi:hypothetical protein JW887_04035 [Candidatus Dojkabacteria bacterium]|nr:hypothetical protein [Candidatus Dojkabacteria bacterium]